MYNSYELNNKQSNDNIFDFLGITILNYVINDLRGGDGPGGAFNHQEFPLSYNYISFNQIITLSYQSICFKYNELSLTCKDITFNYEQI